MAVIGALTAGPAAPAAAAALPQAAPARAGGGISPRDLGAIGDGQFRPLATRFPTLAAAREAFPSVTSLDQSLDGAAIQTAIDLAEPAGGRVVLPAGRYVLSDSLRLPNAVTLEGEARRGSIIDNQNWPLAAPLIVNKGRDAFLYATIRNLSLHGGTHALKVAVEREVAGLVIEGVIAQLQTVANLEFDSIQTAVIRDCQLMHGQHGLRVNGFPCNAVMLENVRIGAHAAASIRLRSADLVAVVGGSIEGGSTPGEATIHIETGGAYANQVAFRHVYFENTHAVLLRCRGTNGVSFDGCKFSGAASASGALIPYRFDCADDLIEFGTNRWDLPTDGPRQALATGRNDNLRLTGHRWESRSAGAVRLVTRGYSPADATTMLRLRLGNPAQPGSARWWRATLDLVVTGRVGGRLTERRAAFTLFAEERAKRLVTQVSAHGEGGLPVPDVAIAADGRSGVLGFRLAATPDFQPVEAVLTLAAAGGGATGLPIEVDAL